MTFAEYLKDLRVKSGMSQNQLGRKLGFKDGQFVSNWERGLVDVPFKRIFQLAEIFKVPHGTMNDVFMFDAKRKLEEKYKAKV